MGAPSIQPIVWNPATHDLWRAAETGESASLPELLSRGADINAHNEAGVTPLMLAAYYGQTEMVRALTDHGADLNAMDRDGYTAAMLARHSGHREIVRILLARGARKTSASPVYESLLAKDLTPDISNDSEVITIAGPRQVKKLHEPRDIWEVVPETHAEFDPKSALLGHLPSRSDFLLVALALILITGAVISFIRVTGWSDSTAPAAQAEDAQPAESSPSSEQSSSSQAVAPATLETPVAVASPPDQSSQSGSDSSRFGAGAASLSMTSGNEAHSDKPADKPLAKPRPQATVKSDNVSSEPPANAVNQEANQTPKASEPKPADAVNNTDREKTAGQAEGKKEEPKEEPKKDSDEATRPRLVIPPKPAPTPELR